MFGMPTNGVDSFKIYKNFTDFLESNFRIDDNRLNKIDINSLLNSINTTTDPTERQRLLEIQMKLIYFYNQATEEKMVNGYLGNDDFFRFYSEVEKQRKINVYKKGNIYVLSAKELDDEELLLSTQAEKLIKEYIPKFDTKLYIIPGIQDNNASHAYRDGKSFLAGGVYKGKELFTLGDDIFSHELGHFILEQLNPKFRDSVSLEAKTIHESFADTVSFLDSAKDKSNKEKLSLNNLYSENPVSVHGEIKGTNERIVRRFYTTSDYNKLKEELPEEHILSVPITESIYHVWAHLVEDSIKQGKTKDEAVDYATSTIQAIIKKAAEKTDPSLNSYLNSIIQSAPNEELRKLFIQEFSKRNLPFK
jgi:hypothetical protein